jgi:hypothetical protein
VQAPPPPPLRHRRDGSTLLGLLAVVFGLAWLAAGTHLFRLSAEGVLAVALMVLGAATVITARTDWALSRRSWPVWLGAIMLLALVVSSVSPRFSGGLRPLRIGSDAQEYTTWAEVPPTIDGSVGRTVVDLRGLPGPPPQDTVLQVDGGIGSVLIQLPGNLHVHLDARVGVGRIFVNDQGLDGGISTRAQEDLDANAPGPILTLRVNTSVGSVRITEPPPTIAAPSAP